jgi:probable addiction module antidote protein
MLRKGADGMTVVARGAGITRAALYRTLSRKGDPKLTTLLGAMKSLGFRLAARAAKGSAR